MVKVMKSALIVSFIVMISGCSLGSAWDVMTNPNTYEYHVNDDGTTTTYIRFN